MEKNRLEAFSDGVIAIIITIMVLELKVPHGDTLEALTELWPVFVSYVLSFLYVGIYWNNHHHMLQACTRVNGGVLWANLALLFWLSLLPFTTGWMGENHFSRVPMALYGFNLFMCGATYVVLQFRLAAAHESRRAFSEAIGSDTKGKISLLGYIVGMLLCGFVSPWFGFAVYVAVALLWLVPDRRMSRFVQQQSAPEVGHAARAADENASAK